jgi:hypothetical protein
MELTREEQSFAFLGVTANSLSLVKTINYSTYNTVVIQKSINSYLQPLNLDTKIIIKNDPNILIKIIK